jgi:hypothetical protein
MIFKMASGLDKQTSLSERIMRKNTTTAKLVEVEIERNKEISKKRYIEVHNGTVLRIEPFV